MHVIAAKSLQPLPNHSLVFINIKKQIHTNVNSEVELPKYSHQDVTLQVRNNPKVTEITSFFRTSCPPHH